MDKHRGTAPPLTSPTSPPLHKHGHGHGHHTPILISSITTHSHHIPASSPSDGSTSSSPAHKPGSDGGGGVDKHAKASRNRHILLTHRRQKLSHHLRRVQLLRDHAQLHRLLERECLQRSLDDAKERREGLVKGRVERRREHWRHVWEVVARRDKKVFDWGKRVRDGLVRAETRRDRVVRERREAGRRRVEDVYRVKSELERKRVRAAEEKRSEIERGLKRSEVLRKLALEARVRKKLIEAARTPRVVEMLSADDAARLIQRWWRRSIWIRSALLRLSSTGFRANRDVGTETEFQDSMIFIRRSDVIQAVGHVLVAVFRAASSAASSTVIPPNSQVVLTTKNTKQLMAAARVFLSGWLMRWHPSDVLNVNGNGDFAMPKDRIVFENCEKLFAAYDALVSVFVSQRLSLQDSRAARAAALDDAAIRDFTDAFAAFRSSFEAWQREDTQHLLNDMLQHYARLQYLWIEMAARAETVTEDVEAWRNKIHQQRLLLREQIERLPGGKEALAEQTQRESMEERSSEIALLSPTQNRSFEANVDVDADLSMVSSSVASESMSPPDSILRGGSATTPTATAPEGNAEATREALQAHSQLSGLDNLALLHELVMEPDFRLGAELEAEERGEVIVDDSGSDDPRALAERVRRMALKAFFARVRSDWQTDDGRREWALSLLVDIQKGLLELVPVRLALHQQVVERLEPTQLRSSIQSGRFDQAQIFAFVLDTMRRICAPLRDEAIHRLIENAHTADPVAVIERVMRLLELMRLDVANHRLAAARPHLLQHGQSYEREAFRRALSDGPLTLNATRGWLESAVVRVKAEKDKRNPEGVDHLANRIRYSAVFVDAILYLLSDASAALPMPETFRMDDGRIFSIRRQVKDVCIVATMMTVTRNAFPHAFKAMRDASGDQLRELAASLLTVVSLPAVVESALTLRLAGVVIDQVKLATPKDSAQEELDSRKKQLQSVVAKILGGRDPIFLIVRRRVQALLRQHLTALTTSSTTSSTSIEEVKVQRLHNTGLEYVAEELGAALGRVRRLVAWNQGVYVEWYDEIIGALLAD